MCGHLYLCFFIIFQCTFFSVCFKDRFLIHVIASTTQTTLLCVHISESDMCVCVCTCVYVCVRVSVLYMCVFVSFLCVYGYIFRLCTCFVCVYGYIFCMCTCFVCVYGYIFCMCTCFVCVYVRIFCRCISKYFCEKIRVDSKAFIIFFEKVFLCMLQHVGGCVALEVYLFSRLEE